MKLTLQVKILGLTIFVIVSGLLFNTYLTLHQIRETSQNAFREQATVLTQTLDASIGSREELLNKEKLQSIIYKTIWLNASVVQINICLATPQGYEIIASNDTSLIGTTVNYETNYFDEKGVILTETDFLEAFAPILIGGQRMGIYNIKLSLESEKKAVSAAQKESLLVGLAITFVTILILSLLAKKVVIDPIKNLKEGVKIIGGGNLTYKMEVATNDEIGDLTQSFNEMAVKLGKSHSELENRVKKRTEELQEKVQELERFQKLAVGRELKMIELKKALRWKQ